MEEITLTQLLDIREARVQRQKALLHTHGGCLVCLTLNIPGPRKVTAQTGRIFAMAMELVCARLKGLGCHDIPQQQVHTPAGSEGYFSVDLPPETLKAAMVEIEESSPVARLFDVDVLTADGKKVSREDLGLPGRKCLLCNRDAPICARSRAHRLAELEEKTVALMTEAITRMDARRVASLAVRGLLYEACAAPKPGLVDRLDSGSHKDMDIFTFMSSAAALQSYFGDCFLLGQDSRHAPPQETFRRLRLPGMLAEQEMYRATGNVNTHKGAIFSLGLICGALGRLEEEDRRNPEAISQMCAKMTSGLTHRELTGKGAAQSTTHGEMAYWQHGVGGIRAQAEAGFPDVVNTGLPALQKALAQGYNLEESGCAALVSLMSVCVDTNLIARGGFEAQQQTAAQARTILAQENIPSRQTLAAWNREMTEKHLSPGGCADLLAITYFLHFLQTEP